MITPILFRIKGEPPLQLSTIGGTPSVSDNSNIRIHAANWGAQTFTVTGAGCLKLNSITFSVMKGTGNGVEAADLTVEVRNVSGVAPATVPGANVLASQTVPLADVSTSGYTDKTVVFAAPPEISGGSQYALVIYTTGGSAGKAYRLGMDDGNPYGGGRYIKSEDSGGNWTADFGGALDVRMSICVTPCPGGCVYSQGYWKNHELDWPVTSLTLGTVSYNETQLLSILNYPVGGNGLISLANQLIAAKLNVANGAAVPTGIAAAIAAADAMIGSLVVPPVGSDYLNPDNTGTLNETLDQYNNGLYASGPPHCEE